MKKKKSVRKNRKRKNFVKSHRNVGLLIGGLLLKLGASPACADDHRIYIGGDTDEDLLRDNEEIVIGSDPNEADQDGNQIVDGVDLAQRLHTLITELPTYSPNDDKPTTGTYAVDHSMLGVVSCLICGESVNMGYIEIVDPRFGIQIEYSYMAMHFLEHGSFTHKLETRWPRVSVARLQNVLDPHIVPVDGDADGDLIADVHEPGLGYNPSQGDQLPPTDVRDGAQLARRTAYQIDRLVRYDESSGQPLPESGIIKVLYEFRGLVSCSICGEVMNMGYMTIMNRDFDTSIDISFLEHHHLKHGSIDFLEQDASPGSEAQSLLSILDPHIMPNADDSDRDGLNRADERALGYHPHNPDENENNVIDGVELAKILVMKIKELEVINWPDPAPTDRRYVIVTLLDGLEICQTCGRILHMDIYEIHDPVRGKEIYIPYMAIHAMEHGSFDCDGEYNEYRLDVPLLADVLGLDIHTAADDKWLLLE